MKPSMLFAIVMLTIIIIMASFDIQLIPISPVPVPENAVGHMLYVCPAQSEGWRSVATTISMFSRPILMGLAFVTIVLAFVWGWALYQNLLEDKFKREKFVNPWKFTKFLFWVYVALGLVMATPNHFKTVHLRGEAGDWILCENNSPNARVVPSNIVTR